MKLDLFWCHKCGAVKAVEDFHWTKLRSNERSLPRCCQADMEIVSARVGKMAQLGGALIFEVSKDPEDLERGSQIQAARAGGNTK